MKRVVGMVLLIVLQLGTAVGWLVYGAENSEACDVNWHLRTELTPEHRQMQENLAMWYNLNLSNAGEGQPMDGYEQILFLEDGLMCCITFPQEEKILPIWHGAREKQDVGLRHLPRSALPLGGKGNHTVLTCRETDLGGLSMPEKGDPFVLHILDRTITYRVCDVRTVKQTDETPEGEVDKALCSIWIRRETDWVIVRAVRET